MNGNEEKIFSQMPQQPPRGMGRIFFILLTFGFLAVTISGLFWIFALSSTSPVGFGWFLFSFAAGLSMIVLPCTLPLAFVIVPLSLGKGYVKGLATALSFGLGVAITLSMYGILAALLGRAVFSFSGGSGEVIKNIFYAIAGVFAIVFALGELGVLKFRMPSYGGVVPAFIQKRKDILKPFLLGLFLGNIGVGCPHPATPIILGQIGIVGDVFYGWLLFFVHAIGRVLPLLILAMLGILGINATKALMRHKDAIARATGWGMVFVGGFLFVLGFFGHNWWVYSGQHSLLELVTQEERLVGILSDRLQVAPPHIHGLEELEGKTGFFGAPLWLGNWVLFVLWVLPMWWVYMRAKRKLKTLPETEKYIAQAALCSKKWIFLLLSALIALIFLYNIPHWFQQHKALEMLEKEKPPEVETLMELYPAEPIVGRPTTITFFFKDARGNPLQGLQIEHERILHAQVISEDFEVFGHFHPEDIGAVNAEAVKNAVFPTSYIFPKTGRYLVAVDFKHSEHEIAKQFFVDVGDRGAPTIVKDLSREKNFFTYTVSLTSEPEELVAGKAATLHYLVKRYGEEVFDLWPYLGAPLHVTVVGLDMGWFEHTHGEVHDPTTGEARHELASSDRFGPELEAHVTFPYPGLYQVFGEFLHRNEVTVTRFLLEVKPGQGTSEPNRAPDNH